MNADQFIAARVSPETKARLRELAERQQLSESALLRRLVELMLQTAGGAPIITASPISTEAARIARLMIRLRADDQLLLRERAAARGIPPATYVSVLIRSHLRSLAPLPREELLALRRTLAELGSIGRNLNQIARVAHQTGRVEGLTTADLRAILAAFEGLRGHFKRLIEANIASWEADDAKASR